MPYITSVERIGHKRGVEEGMLAGIQIGEQKGIQIGEQKGEQRGKADMLLRLLTRRFGTLSASLQERVNAADTETLELWSDLVLDARSLADVFSSNININ
ncbi:MAG: DUF4351 domain-containing protein [Magnetococcus sp. DMHC-6]